MGGVVDFFSDVGKGISDAAYDVGEGISDAAYDVGEGISDAAYDVYTGAVQMYDVITGKYANQQKSLMDKQEKYVAKVAEYERIMSGMKNKFIIPEEIFQIAYGNKMERTAEGLLGPLDMLRIDLERSFAEFNSQYKFIQSMLNDTYLKYFMWVPLVIGGLMSDASDLLTKGDWTAGRRLLNTALSIIGIVILVVITVFSWGSSAWVTVPAIIALIGSIIGLVMFLDGAYGQGLLMNAVWSSLDLLLNEVLQLDNVKELGTNKLSDSKYYAELTGYFATINTIVTITASIVMVYANPQGFADVSRRASSGMLGSSTSTASTMFSTYTQLSQALNIAQTVGDIIEQNRLSDELKKKLEADKDIVYNKITTMMRNRIMQSYRETEDMLQYTSNIVSEYVMSGFSTPTSTFDPEMIIASNFGYRYNGENFMDFGVDAAFNEGSQAGTSSYTSNILYKL